jgi:hypothetical protein
MFGKPGARCRRSAGDAFDVDLIFGEAACFRR